MLTNPCLDAFLVHVPHRSTALARNHELVAAAVTRGLLRKDGRVRGFFFQTDFAYSTGVVRMGISGD